MTAASVAAHPPVARGSAYRDFATTDEIQAEREAAQQAGRQFTYSRRWEAKTPTDAKRFESEGRQAVVRLKMPREGKCIFHDHVRGRVEVDWTQEADHVIQRADGSALEFLYHGRGLHLLEGKIGEVIGGPGGDTGSSHRIGHALFIGQPAVITSMVGEDHVHDEAGEKDNQSRSQNWNPQGA